MSGIMDGLLQQLAGGSLKDISGKIGADEKSTGNAISAALPMLLGAMAKNASSSSEAESLSAALGKDHDGSILDNLGGFLGNAQNGPGDDILGHVLGRKRPALESGISRSSGIDAGSVARLLPILAPIVMGYLGRQKRQQNLDASGLAGLLGQERQQVERVAPQQMSALDKLLDSDGDGDVDLGDLMKGAGKLGKLFGN